MRQALAGAESQTFAPNETIVAEGAAADAFYIISRGTADVFKQIDGSEVQVGRLQRGQYFGEIGLLQNIPRTATVRAAADAAVTVLKLTREAFLDLVDAPDLSSAEIARIMRKRISTNELIEAVRRLSAEELVALLPEFEIQTLRPGATIVREGDVADFFYILDAGEAIVTVRKDGAEEFIGALAPGNYFGEIGMLSGQPRAASVQASGSSPVVVLRTDKEGFAKLISEMPEQRMDLAAALMERLKDVA